MNSSAILDLPFAYIIAFWKKNSKGELVKDYAGFKLNWTLQTAKRALKEYETKGIDGCVKTIGVERQIGLEGNDLIVVDIDDASVTYEQVIEMYPILSDTLYVPGNTKGYHFYFKTDWKGQNLNKCLTKVEGDIVYRHIFELEDKDWIEKPIQTITSSQLKEMVLPQWHNKFNDEADSTDGETESVASVESASSSDTIPFTDYERAILDNIDHKFITDYMSWIKFLWAIRFSNFHNALDIADQYSKKIPGYVSREEVRTKMMDSRHEKIGWGYLMNLSKKSNPQVYSEIIKKNRLKNKKQESQDLDAENTRIFKELAAEFEKTHCKIIDHGFYVRDEDNEVAILDEKVLVKCYKHLQSGSTSNGAPISFINRWIFSNPDIRQKKKIGIYPAKCPENTYNLWKPFDMELVQAWTQDDAAVELFKRHIMILCNNEEIVATWFMRWIAHAIQCPETKNGMMPTFVSNQGAGKNTLLEILQKIMGRSKILDSSNPARDVYGSFNGLMKDAFLVSLSELSPKDLKDASGRIKALITDGTLLINQKGVDAYEITSYHRFMVFTNHEETIKPTKDDRRNCVIRCSDELCKKDSFGNSKPEAELQKITDYIKKIRPILDDENALKNIYEMLKLIDVSTFMDESPPQTDFHKTQSQLSVNPIDSFMKHLTLENHHNIDIEMSSGLLYSEFRNWNAKNNNNYDCTSQQFGVRLKNLKIQGITQGKHTRNGEMKIINIPLLKQRYQITEVENDDDNEDKEFRELR